MKVRLLLAALCAAVGALLLILPASAAPTDSNAGTIKVKAHGDALFPPEDDPQITGCPAAFDVYAYHFAHASVHWNITQQPPTGTAWVTGGTAELSTDSPQPPEGPRYSGYLTQNMQLPDGHYEVDASEVGSNGTGKQKVFWVKSSCASSGGGGGTGGGGGGNGGGGNGGGGNGGGGTGNGGGGGGAGAGQGSSPSGTQGSAPQGGVLAATASLNGSPAQGAVLAQTGLPLGGLLYGVLLIVSGLVLRRRR